MVTFMARSLTRADVNSRALLTGLTFLSIAVIGCGGGENEVSQSLPSGCADVTEAVVTREAAGTYRFDVTIESADTGWEKYADAWEVRAPDGTVLGTRILAHPHVDEQPFTRSLTGVELPDGVEEVVVAARDSVVGFCGEELSVRIS